MLSRTSWAMRRLTLQTKFSFAFQKFDYEDPLNLKSLLTDDEIMVKLS